MSVNIEGYANQAGVVNGPKSACPQLVELYDEIYVKGNMRFWNNLAVEIEEYCAAHSIKHINYFYHKELVEAKLKPK